jgi:hypothetical protein
MQPNNLSDELSVDLLTHDLNSRSFLMSLRRQNETYREICTSQRDRQYPSKYCSFNNSRGFSRMNKSYSSIPSRMISQDGIAITDDLSKELLDDSLCTVRRHWQKSKMTFSDKVKYIQTDLSSHTNISLKKAMCGCQVALFSWISKNRFR